MISSPSANDRTSRETKSEQAESLDPAQTDLPSGYNVGGCVHKVLHSHARTLYEPNIFVGSAYIRTYEVLRYAAHGVTSH